MEENEKVTFSVSVVFLIQKCKYSPLEILDVKVIKFISNTNITV